MHWTPWKRDGYEFILAFKLGSPRHGTELPIFPHAFMGPFHVLVLQPEIPPPSRTSSVRSLPHPEGPKRDTVLLIRLLSVQNK